MIFIFCTFPKKSEAQKIGKGLLRKKLIACINMFPVNSSYLWKGKIVGDKEVLAILKARDDNFPQIESYILKNHSYTIPEVVAIKASDVNYKYLDWLEKETK